MIAVMIIAGLLIVFAAIHIVMCYLGVKKYPAPGKIAEFDDTKIHVFSKGKKEDKTEPCIVILHDTADFAPALKHYNLVKELSQIKRTVVPERCGSGWSGDTYAEKTVENIVFEYRKALSVTEEGSKKIILVAFGNTAVYAENWKKSFPDEVYKTVYVNGNEKKYDGIWNHTFKPFLIAVTRELGLLRLYSLLFKNKICPDDSDNNRAVYTELFNERYMSVPVRAEIRFISKNLTNEINKECFDITVNSDDEIVNALHSLLEEKCQVDD